MKLQISYITLMSVITSGLSFIANILMARHFGISKHYDFYLYALSIPLFFSSALNSFFIFAVVPRFLIENKIPERLKKYTLLKLSFFLSLPFLFLSFFPKLLLTNHFSGQDTLVLNDSLIISLAWIIGFIQVNLSGLIAILNVKKEYFYLGLINALPYIGLILTVYMDFYMHIGIILPIFGMLVSLIFTLFLVLRLFKINLHFLYKYKSYNFNFLFRSFTNFFSSLIAMNIFAMYSILDAFIAPSFGEGYLSILGYSHRIIMGVGNIAVAGVFTLMGPAFAEAFKKGGYNLLYLECKKIFIVILILSVLLSLLLFESLDLILHLIFGIETLSPNNEILLLELNRSMLPGMIAMLITSVLFRAIFILKKNSRSLIIIGLGWPLIYILLTNFLRKFGIISFGIAYSAAWIFVLSTVVIVISRSRYTSITK